MIEHVREPERPSRFKRVLFRSPIFLYRIGLGFLLGRRFLLLRHVGRRSGRIRETVLEVTRFDEARDVYQVAAGFGPRSDWYRNLLAHPNAEIQVGRESRKVRARALSSEESGEAMVDYWKRHPRAAKALQRLLAIRIDDTEEDYRSVGREHIPFVDLVPR